MSINVPTHPETALPTSRARADIAKEPTHSAKDPSYQAFMILRTLFAVLPFVFGLDKFWNVLVNWPSYLAPWINDIIPGTAQQFMYFVGITEMVAGILVALKPRYASYVVVAWLAGIVTNLFTFSGFYDVALRDFALLIGAIALTRLARVYDPPFRSRKS